MDVPDELIRLDMPGRGGTSQNYAMSNLATDVGSEQTDLGVIHPDITAERHRQSVQHAIDKFEEPDPFGVVECVICVYGIFNKHTINTSMGNFYNSYYKNRNRFPRPTLFKYMSKYWNEDVRTEYTDVPVITPSIVEHHFCVCRANENPVEQLDDMLARTNRVINTIENGGLYVATNDCDEADEGGSSGRLHADERRAIENMERSLSAIQTYLNPGRGGGDTQVARRTGLNRETQEKLCHKVDQMQSQLKRITAKKTRKRKRRVAVSHEDAKLMEKFIGRFAQLSKTNLEWRKYQDGIDMEEFGLHTQKRKKTQSYTDIYTGKKTTASASARNDTAVSAGAGDVTDRFVSY